MDTWTITTPDGQAVEVKAEDESTARAVVSSFLKFKAAREKKNPRPSDRSEPQQMRSWLITLPDGSAVEVEAEDEPSARIAADEFFKFHTQQDKRSPQPSARAVFQIGPPPPTGPFDFAPDPECAARIRAGIDQHLAEKNGKAAAARIKGVEA